MGKGEGLAASDLIRSMKHIGFGRDEIYDVLVGAGLPGEEVQLLIDRVAAEFYEANLEPQSSRLAKEVRDVFRSRLEEVQHGLSARIESLSRGLELVKVEIEKLSDRILELQSIAVRLQTLGELGKSGPERLIKSHKFQVGKCER